MKNKFLVFILAFCLPLMVSAQDAPVAKTFWDDPFNHPMAPFYFLIVAVGVVVLLVLVVAIMLIQVLNTFLEKTARERAAQLGITYVPELSWWKKKLP